MFRSRWLHRLLAAGLLLVGAIVPVRPAMAAGCGANCYTYVDDISVMAWTDLPWPVPVLPGSIQSFTARVTNQGWRIGGTSVVPSPGPASRKLSTNYERSTPQDFLGCQVDVGPSSICTTYDHQGAVSNEQRTVSCDFGSMPTNTTYQVTLFFRAPYAFGTYTMRIWVYEWSRPEEPYSATHYNPGNNSVTLTFQVGYWA
jgi:hypothetical protein